MSLHSNRFFSNALGHTVSVQVVLPEIKNAQMRLPQFAAGTRFPTLWLLHGLGDDDTVWLRRAGVERLANNFGVALVMPAVDRSFYADMTYGGQYWTYLTQELPARMRFTFPLATDREHNFVVGYSMGGYGALRWALTQPDHFKAVATMSAIVDLPKFIQGLQDGTLGYPDAPDPTAIWGGQDVHHSDLNLDWLLTHPTTATADLSVYTTAGGPTDFLNADNLRYRAKFARAFGTHYTWEPGTNGHNWNFWTPRLERIMSWLPLNQGGQAV